jgi:hypothetical protein
LMGKVYKFNVRRPERRASEMASEMRQIWEGGGG